jgi:hypothetical protein
MVNDRKTAGRFLSLGDVSGTNYRIDAASRYYAATVGPGSTAANLRRQRRKTENRLLAIPEMAALKESRIHHRHQGGYHRENYYASHAPYPIRLKVARGSALTALRCRGVSSSF